MTELFFEAGTHPLYERVRDPEAWLHTINGYEDATAEMHQQKVDSFLAVKRRMEVAWQVFEGMAENNFAHGLQTNFWPGWFELYLQHMLMEFELDNLATNGEGEPDFIVHQAGVNQFDIEATMLTAGKGASAAPQFQMPESGVAVHNVSDTIWNTGPHGEILGDKLERVRNPQAQSDFCLRITGSLAAKLEQIQRWKGAGEYDPTILPVVVAISTADIEHETGGWVDESLFERVLYGKGNGVIPIGSDGKLKSKESYFAKQATMTNKNEAVINLALFDQKEYQDISVVAHFPDWLLEYGDKPPVFYLNPNAPATFPMSVLPIGAYKTVENGSIKVVADYRRQS